MINYQRLMEYHNELLKAERCFRLMDAYLDTNYVENEEQIRLIINTALDNTPGMREVLLDSVDSSALREIKTAPIESFLETLSEMLVQVNLAIFDDYIIGFDIIEKYYLNKD